MKNPILVLPSPQYKKSFLEAIEEYQREGLPQYVNLNINEIRENFDYYVNEIINQSKGINLPEGYVFMTRFWLVDNQQFIGRFNIRHELTESLRMEGGHIGYDIRPTKRNQGYGTLGLKLALLKANQLGLNKVLLTCDKDNEASRKIIQKKRRSNGSQKNKCTAEATN